MVLQLHTQSYILGKVDPPYSTILENMLLLSISAYIMRSGEDSRKQKRNGGGVFRTLQTQARVRSSAQLIFSMIISEIWGILKTSSAGPILLPEEAVRREG